MDYRESHKAEGKGVQYSQEFINKKYRHFLWKKEQHFLLKIINGISATEKYLDFACGTGRILTFLEGHFTQSFGVDVSSSMLAVAERSVRKSTLIHKDITREAFNEKDFSAITSFRFFLNAEPELRREVMQKLSSLLGTRGWLIFNNHMNRWSLHSMLVRLGKKLRGDKRHDFKTLSHSEIDKLVKEAGLTIHAKYHYGFLPVLNENTSLPIKIIAGLEKLLFHLRLFNPLSTCVIYVCKKD